MHRFLRRAPLTLSKHEDPGEQNRAGLPLSRGSLLILLSTVASEDLSPETLGALRNIDADAWYPGQDFESIINELEDKDAALPELMGRNIYFMFRTSLREKGFVTASDVLSRVPQIWLFATRGDCGVWRSQELGKLHFRMEAEQPYNCMFEMGALRGFIEAFDGRDVVIAHETCMRSGAPFCTFDVRWDE